MAVKAQPKDVAAPPKPRQARTQTASRPKEVIEKEEVIIESTSARTRERKLAKAAPESMGKRGTDVAGGTTPQIAAGNYKIVSIYPRTGEFQQAWLRAPSGRIVVVGAGDELDGAKVQSVDFVQHVVKTSQGQIR